VFLNDETATIAAIDFGRRLFGFSEISFPSVFGERHAARERGNLPRRRGGRGGFEERMEKEVVVSRRGGAMIFT